MLITSFTMASRTGGVLYVRDLALRLLRIGHLPLVYSPNLGPVADELRRATIPVIDDLSTLAAPPDVVHGNHTLETIVALLQFPEVPAVFVCHGWSSWATAAPRLDRVLRYVAVDDTCRDQLHCIDGIPADRIEVVLNWVDLDRFQPRGPLPGQPERALVFSNQAREDGSHLPIIREACQRLGLRLDVVGHGVSASVARPEEMLRKYDLVFAKAKCALEALAVGCAVVVCDDRGLGPMVTSQDLNRLRRLNFGARSLQGRIEPDAVMAEIKRYDPLDAAAVSSRLRAEAGLDEAVDRLVELYREVIDEQAAGRSDPVANGRTVARYLRQLNARLIEHDGVAEWNRVLRADKERLVDERDQLQLEVAALRSRLHAHGPLQAEAEALRRSLDALSATSTFRLRALVLQHPVGGPLARAANRFRRRVLRQPPA